MAAVVGGQADAEVRLARCAKKYRYF